MKKQLKIIRDMLLIIAAIALAFYLFYLLMTSSFIVFISIMCAFGLWGLYENVKDWHKKKEPIKPEDNDKQ